MGKVSTDQKQAVYGQIEQGDHMYIVASIVEAAAEYFAGCPEDFCIQHVATTHIVFGGTNRLIWNPKHGFSCDESYCRPEFIALCEALRGR